MDCNKTENYIREKQRMCDESNACKGCPLSQSENGKRILCPEFEHKYADEAIEIVQKWSDEHPLPKPKTYAEDFFEKLPNAPKSKRGLPCTCINSIYGLHKRCTGDFCKYCWNEPIEEV